MKHLLGLALLSALGCSHVAGARAPLGADPAQSDGDKYRVLLENEQVRVLRYHDEPGAKTRMHHHPRFVLYALGPFRRRLTFPDGSQHEREFKAGDVIWMPAQSHVGENVGSSPTDSLLVELKSAAATAP